MADLISTSTNNDYKCMKINYSLTKDDFKNFGAYQLKIPRFRKYILKTKLTAFLLGLISFAIVPFISSSDDFMPWLLGIIVILGIFIFITPKSFFIMQAKAQFNQLPNMYKKDLKTTITDILREHPLTKNYCAFCA